MKKKETGVQPPSMPMGELPPQPQAPNAPQGTPIEQILTMQRQGLSNYQVIQTLQHQGFSSQQIFDAMNQASIKGGVAPTPAEDMLPAEMDSGMMPSGGPPTSRAPQMGQQPMHPPMAQQGQMGPMPPPGMPYPPQASQGIEETVEAVVEEKWKELGSTLSKMNEWKDATEAKVNRIQQSIADLKSDMDNLHKAIVAKIGEYDQNILNVGTEIKAMEKVFSKVLPQFTENVNELSRVARNIKKK